MLYQLSYFRMMDHISVKRIANIVIFSGNEIYFGIFCPEKQHRRTPQTTSADMNIKTFALQRIMCNFKSCTAFTESEPNLKMP